MLNGTLDEFLCNVYIQNIQKVYNPSKKKFNALFSPFLLNSKMHLVSKYIDFFYWSCMLIIFISKMK